MYFCPCTSDAIGSDVLTYVIPRHGVGWNYRNVRRTLSPVALSFEVWTPGQGHDTSSQ